MCPRIAVEIKFRQSDIARAAHRLDPVLKSLSERLKASGLSREETAEIKQATKSRETLLTPLYLQIAHSFADLHDTPGRMLAKGCISRVVPWKNARREFYLRLRRRLVEQSFGKRLCASVPNVSPSQARELLHRWFADATRDGAALSWSDDRAILSWLAKSGEYLGSCMARLRREQVADQVVKLGLTDASAVVSGVLALLSKLPVDQRETVVAALRRGVIFADPLASRNPDDPYGYQFQFADYGAAPEESYVPPSTIGFGGFGAGNASGYPSQSMSPTSGPKSPAHGLMPQPHAIPRTKSIGSSYSDSSPGGKPESATGGGTNWF